MSNGVTFRAFLVSEMNERRRNRNYKKYDTFDDFFYKEIDDAPTFLERFLEFKPSIVIRTEVGREEAVRYGIREGSGISITVYPEWEITEYPVRSPDPLLLPPAKPPIFIRTFRSLDEMMGEETIPGGSVLISTLYVETPPGSVEEVGYSGRVCRGLPTPSVPCYNVGYGILPVGGATDSPDDMRENVDRVRGEYRRCLGRGSDRRFAAVTRYPHKFFPRKELTFVTNYARERHLDRRGKCRCYRPSILRTVNKEGENKGRRFHCCSWNRCRHFIWEEVLKID